MDHSYLESTVAPVLIDALTQLSLRLAPTHTSRLTTGHQQHQPHPYIDPIEFVAKHLILCSSESAIKCEQARTADDHYRLLMRDQVLVSALEAHLRNSIPPSSSPGPPPVSTSSLAHTVAMQPTASPHLLHQLDTALDPPPPVVPMIHIIEEEASPHTTSLPSNSNSSSSSSSVDIPQRQDTSNDNPSPSISTSAPIAVVGEPDANSYLSSSDTHPIQVPTGSGDGE